MVPAPFNVLALPYGLLKGLLSLSSFGGLHSYAPLGEQHKRESTSKEVDLDLTYTKWNGHNPLVIKAPGLQWKLVEEGAMPEGSIRIDNKELKDALVEWHMSAWQSALDVPHEFTPEQLAAFRVELPLGSYVALDMVFRGTHNAEGREERGTVWAIPLKTMGTASAGTGDEGEASGALTLDDKVLEFINDPANEEEQEGMHRKQLRKAVGNVASELVELKASLRTLVADKGLGLAAPTKAGAASLRKSSASLTELAVLEERLSLVVTHQLQAKKDQEDQFQALDAKLQKLMKALVREGP